MQGKCDLCGSFSELNRCPSCGRLVCGSCFDFSKGLCIVCAQGSKFEERKDKRDYIE
ncbi:MAG: orotate phosphoribosyltransferase [Candidatus Thermoplasmatota archaeon]|nr:orotate phosphoribosyltransferase [Candidatus Thermoplasmatota archaeon]